MSHRRRRCAAPLRVTAGLIIGFASAVTTAGPPIVSPDEAAGLSPVVAVAQLEDASPLVLPDNVATGDEPDLTVASAGLVPPVVCIDEACSNRLHPVLCSGGCSRLSDFPRQDARNWDGEADGTMNRLKPLTTNGDCSVSCDTAIGADPAIAWDRGFAAGVDESTSAVVRAQSPEINLLPLSTGDAEVETTSLLSAATGTSGRLRADYLTDFDETDRIGVHAITQVWNGVGVDTEANYWQRPLAGQGREPLWTGDFNILYSFPPHPRFKLRSGAGAAWTVDDGDLRTGYNVTHGIDVYLLWRAMVTGELDWGQIDSDKLFRYRVAFGLTFASCELFTGYESYELGDEKLDGWVNGIAFWY